MWGAAPREAPVRGCDALEAQRRNIRRALEKERKRSAELVAERAWASARGRHVFDHWCELSLRRPHLSRGPDSGTGVLSIPSHGWGRAADAFPAEEGRVAYSDKAELTALPRRRPLPSVSRGVRGSLLPQHSRRRTLLHRHDPRTQLLRHSLPHALLRTIRCPWRRFRVPPAQLRGCHRLERAHLIVQCFLTCERP